MTAPTSGIYLLTFSMLKKRDKVGASGWGSCEMFYHGKYHKKYIVEIFREL